VEIVIKVWDVLCCSVKYRAKKVSLFLLRLCPLPCSRFLNVCYPETHCSVKCSVVSQKTVKKKYGKNFFKEKSTKDITISLL